MRNWSLKWNIFKYGYWLLSCGFGLWIGFVWVWKLVKILELLRKLWLFMGVVFRFWLF